MIGASFHQDQTFALMEMVLARWDRGSFTVTGWGLFWFVISTGSFGSFVRELVRRRRA